MKKALQKQINSNLCKGANYTIMLYQAKYIFALALCLPSTLNTEYELSIDSPDDVDVGSVRSSVYKAFENWSKTNTMLTQQEIQDYITKMREEQKNIVLNKYNVLNVDDLQLMKDMKRFGLKVTDDAAFESGTMPDDINTNVVQPDAFEIEGENEYNMETTDPDGDMNL
jgi:hypothetical protein